MKLGNVNINVLIVVTLGTPTMILGQPLKKEIFDVASVKRCSQSDPGTNGGLITRGRVQYGCLTLLTYIKQAYGYWSNGELGTDAGIISIVGEPRWANTELYQIAAKADGSQGVRMMLGPMMQSLLTERFRLKLHREVRSVPVYQLLVDRSGLKVPPAKVACFAPGSGRPAIKPGQAPPPLCGQGRRMRDSIGVYGATLSEFCAVISRRLALRLDRMVVDKTGINGRFDFDIRLPEEEPQSSGLRDATGTVRQFRSDDVTKLKEGLHRVGLRLESGVGSGEVLVVDHVERPTAN